MSRLMLLKKLVLTILLLSLILNPLSTSLTVNADIPLHKNPGTLPEEVDPYFLLLFYTFLLRSILYPGEYNLTQLMDMYNYMFIPQDLRAILDRLNKLIMRLNDEINETRLHIDLAKLYINYKVYSDALNELEEAGYWLAHANITFNQLSRAIDNLIRNVGRFGPPSGRIGEVRAELLSLLDEIESLMEYLRELMNNLEVTISREYRRYYKANETTLSIYVNSTSVWIGSYILVYGRLSSGESPLPGRMVYITYLDRAYGVETNGSGWYNAAIYIPYIYRHSLTINVFYRPEDMDVGVYRPSRNMTEIKLLYYDTVVVLSIDSPAHPGLDMRIGVEVYPWRDGLTRNLSIFLDGEPIATYILNISSLEMVYHVPPNASIGYHILRIYIPPRDIYSPAEAYKSFLINYIPIDFGLNISPSLILYPISMVTINGSVRDYDNRPVADAYVNISFGSGSYGAYTDSHGSFSLTMPPPPALWSLSVGIVVDPVEPWYGVTVRTVTMPVLNLFLWASIIGALALIIYVLRLVAGGHRVEALETPIEALREKVEPSVEEVVEAVEKPPMDSDIVRMYYSVVGLLAERVGPPKPEETLREFYRKAHPVLNGLADDFWRLTILTEYTMYSGREPSMEHLSEARELFDRLVGGLHGEG